MSEWRRRAIELMPELRRKLEQPGSTIYGVFFELLERFRGAHARDDTEEMRVIADFAAWCFRQKADDISNAAGVAFYEHLTDEPRLAEVIAEFVPPDVFAGVKPLLEWRLGPEKFAQLCQEYRGRRLGGGRKGDARAGDSR